MKRAIVTGASGFVGINLIQELLRHDYEILAVVRTEHGVEKLRALSGANIHIAVCDIPDFKNLYEAAQGTYDIFFIWLGQGCPGRKTGMVSFRCGMWKALSKP